MSNYVTVLQDGNLFRWQRVQGASKGTSTTAFVTAEKAFEVAQAIADCNGLKFLRPEF